MENNTRVAVVTIMIEDDEAVDKVNALLHDYSKYVIGRMGIPYHEKGINLITIVIDAPADTISALSGKLGRVKGITSKAVYSKKSDV